MLILDKVLAKERFLVWSYCVIALLESYFIGKEVTYLVLTCPPSCLQPLNTHLRYVWSVGVLASRVGGNSNDGDH